MQGTRLAQMLDKNLVLVQQRHTCAQHLELYKNAKDEIDSLAWLR
jgi:hypothetical protein